MLNLLLISALCAIAPVQDAAKPKENKVFELRVYSAAEGKMPDLLNRFKNHTVSLFEKHGIHNVGYWLPVDNKENKLYYVVSFPSKEARTKAFGEFGQDPEWQKVYKESEANGPLVTKIDSTLMAVTDYSPSDKLATSKKPRVFELRTYKAAAGKLADLHSRFKDHTLALFKKHGMTNYLYWQPIEGAKGAEDTLIYFVVHKDAESAKASWDGFRQDPDWVAARDASEKNGKLTDKVESVSMLATEFSPIK